MCVCACGGESRVYGDGWEVVPQAIRVLLPGLGLRGDRYVEPILNKPMEEVQVRDGVEAYAVDWGWVCRVCSALPRRSTTTTVNLTGLP